MEGQKYQVQERQYSDTTSVQSGVEDTSAATKMQGLGQGVATATSGVAPVVQQYKQAEATTATNSAQEQYYESLKKETLMVEQGKSPAEIANFRTKSEQQVSTNLNPEDRMALRSKFEKLAVGGSLGTKSAAQLEVEANNQTIVEYNIDPNDPEATQKARDIRVQNQDMPKYLAELAHANMPAFTRELDAIVAMTDMSDSEKQNLFERKRALMMSETLIAADGDKTKADPIVSMYGALIDSYKLGASAKNQSEAAKAKLERTRAEDALDLYANMSQTERSIFAASREAPPELLSIMTLPWRNQISKFAKNYVGSDNKLQVTLDSTTKKTLASSVALAGQQLVSGSIDPSTESGKIALDLAGEAVKNIEDQAEVAKIVDGTAKSLARYMTELDDIKAAAPGIKALSGELGTWIKGNPELISPAAKGKLSSNLMTYTTDTIAPAISEQFSAIVTNSRGRDGKSIDPRSIDLKVSNGQVIFTDPYGSNQGMMTNLNKKLSGDITTLITAYSNVTGQSPEDVVEALKGQFGVAPSETDPNQELEAVAPPVAVEDGNALDMNADAPVVEKVFDEVTMKDSGNPVVDAQIRDLVSGLDQITDPSLRYVLKRKLAKLNESAGTGIGTGGRTGAVKDKPAVEVGFTEEQQKMGSELLGEVAPAGGETPVPTIGAAMFESIASEEGSGDEVTDVPTSHYGVTEAAAKAVGKEFDVGMSEAEAKEISIQYLDLLDSKFANKVSGWEAKPQAVKQMAINAAYNMGDSKVFGFKGFMSDLKANKTADEVGKNLLDTANAGGKSLRGLALRRARAYNQAAINKIVEVEQKSSGKIIYYDANGGIIFEYTPKGGKHEDSKAMREKV